MTWDDRYREAIQSGQKIFSDTPASSVVSALDTVASRISMDEDAPGLAIDVGAGEGRHSRELARRGYTVIALERSESAVQHAKQTASEKGSLGQSGTEPGLGHGQDAQGEKCARDGGDVSAEQPVGVAFDAETGPVSEAEVDLSRAITWVACDMRDFAPEEPLDLALLAFMHQREFAIVDQLEHIDSWLKPGGWVVFVGHSRAQVGLDVGGPKEPDRLWDPAELSGGLEKLGYETIRAENVTRPDIEKREHAKHRDASIDAVVVARKR